MIDITPAPCTCFTVRRAARQLSQAYDRHLAPSGLRSTQFALLQRLERFGPLGIQVFARSLGMDRTTLARNLQPLEREGLVSIVTAPGDRRGRVLSVTDAGRARLGQARELWAVAQRSFETKFGEGDTASVHQLMDRIARISI